LRPEKRANSLNEEEWGMRVVPRFQLIEYEEEMEDHVKKLFWAVWGAAFLFGQPTPEEMDSSKGLAQLIHENRLKYLYVDTK
jgi:hypothetical protein